MKKIMPFLAGVFLFAAGMTLAGPQKETFPPNQQKPPAILRCWDVKIVSFSAKLDSTQVGTPGIEFPQDKVKLTAMIENAGNIAIPVGIPLAFVLKKNDVMIMNGDLIYGCNAPGAREEMRFGTDSFPHGVNTAYSLEITPRTVEKECKTDNNKASFTIDEVLLHKKMK